MIKTAKVFLLLVLLGLGSLTLYSNKSRNGSVSLQDTTTVAYWKQTAKLAMKEAAAQKKMAEVCTGMAVGLQRKLQQQEKELNECKARK